MNKRLERLKKEEAVNLKKRRKVNRLLLIIMILGVAIAVFAGRVTQLRGSMGTPVEGTQLPPEDDLSTDGPDWRLLIVSPAQVLDRAFTVSLYEVEGKKVDVRMALALMEMLSAAREADVELTLCSTYRSVSTQRGLYERKVDYYNNLGYNEEKSLELAGQYVQPPGASEHHTGLAVDFFSGDATLTEAFAKTSAYEWLQANAADYGFVERYDKDKEALTGIGWEPWHYRYVGKVHAEAMTAEGVCLEEYAAGLADTKPPAL